MNKVSAYLLLATAVATSLAVSGCDQSPGSVATASVVSTVGGNVSDTDVTAHVTAALRQHHSLGGFDIKVVTLKGDVRLTGVLDSQSQMDEAINLARAADGTHSIHDELTIRR